MIGTIKLPVAVLLLLIALPVHADSGVTVIPAPGSYANDQLLSIKNPPNTRLTVYLGGKRLDDIDSPLLLYAEYGEQRSYHLRTELRSLEPEAPLLESRVFEWVIDKKQPAPPAFVLSRDDTGVQVKMQSDEPAEMHYSLYQPYYKALSRGSIPENDPVFLPDNAVLCAYAVDRAGNKSLPASVTADTGVYDVQPFVIINPVSGSWSNRQTLVLETVPGTDVRYTIDGSDPMVSGTKYDGPAVLDRTGPVTLRLAARGPSGKIWSKTVLYTVTERSSPLENVVPLTSGIFEAGLFYEAALPEGYTATIGNPWNAGKPQKTLLFSVPEGVRRLYPVTIRNGSFFWRWVCAVGSHSASETNRMPMAENSLKPQVSIHDWHFLSISYSGPVFYSFDGSSWIQYSEPVVLDRDSSTVLYWYSPSWEKGAVQTVSLPAKPLLSGLPAGGVTSEPVFLTISKSPFTLHYSTGGAFLPTPPVSGVSPVLASGLLLETPQGASETCTVRFQAVHDGLIHGEIIARFVLDRKAPRVPSIGIPAELSWSRSPVSFRVTGEDMVQVSISPEQVNHDGESWILSGLPERPVTYTIRSFSVDRAGNTSPVVEKTVTVDQNAVYVNSEYQGDRASDGSPSAPFTDLDAALDLVAESDPWRIIVKGSVPLNRPHTLRSSLSIVGENAVIHAGPAAVLRAYSNTLSLSGFSLKRTASGVDGETRIRTLPLFDVANGELVLKNCIVNDSASKNTPVIRAENSQVTLKAVKLRTKAREYGIGIDCRNSNLHVRDCLFETTAPVVSAIAVSGGRVTVIDSEIVVSAEQAGRALECWGTKLVLVGVRLSRSGTDTVNGDTALWMDRNTEVITEKALAVTGFQYKKKIGAR